ncbi:MAG: hypothetical protein WCE75_05505 [Terracidiphilus sp.]
MSFYERDYLKRQLKQVALLLARLLGLKQAGQLDDARDELARSASEILGLDPAVLGQLNVQMVMQILGSAERVRVYAELVLAEAELLSGVPARVVGSRFSAGYREQGPVMHVGRCG